MIDPLAPYKPEKGDRVRWVGDVEPTSQMLSRELHIYAVDKDGAYAMDPSKKCRERILFVPADYPYIQLRRRGDFVRCSSCGNFTLAGPDGQPRDPCTASPAASTAAQQAMNDLAKKMGWPQPFSHSAVLHLFGVPLDRLALYSGTDETKVLIEAVALASRVLRNTLPDAWHERREAQEALASAMSTIAGVAQQVKNADSGVKR